MMMMYRQLSRIRYVSQYGLGLVYFVGGRTLLPTTKLFMGCLLPLSFTPTPLRPLPSEVKIAFIIARKEIM